jgi:hypothetical protein
MMVSYTMRLGPVIDLSHGIDSSWDPLWKDFLYTEQLDATDHLGVYDPNGELPRDQQSWS